MKDKKIEFKIKSKANHFNDLISREIKSKMFKKKYNLSGEYSEYGGINLFNFFSFVTFKPNTGPLVKLNIKCVSINESGSQSKLIMEGITGFTYKMHKWFSLLFSFLSISIAIYQIAKNGIDNNFEILIMPLIGIIYYLIVDLITKFSIDSLKNRVLKILKNERIEYKKIS